VLGIPKLNIGKVTNAAIQILSTVKTLLECWKGTVNIYLRSAFFVLFTISGSLAIFRESYPIGLYRSRKRCSPFFEVLAISTRSRLFPLQLMQFYSAAKDNPNRQLQSLFASCLPFPRTRRSSVPLSQMPPPEFTPHHRTRDKIR
jgi:hypothetical protein